MRFVGPQGQVSLAAGQRSGDEVHRRRSEKACDKAIDGPVVDDVRLGMLLDHGPPRITAIRSARLSASI